jgi:hypothetical protein
MGTKKDDPGTIPRSSFNGYRRLVFLQESTKWVSLQHAVF